MSEVSREITLFSITARERTRSHSLAGAGQEEDLPLSKLYYTWEIDAEF